MVLILEGRRPEFDPGGRRFPTRAGGTPRRRQMSFRPPSTTCVRLRRPPRTGTALYSGTAQSVGSVQVDSGVEVIRGSDTCRPPPLQPPTGVEVIRARLPPALPCSSGEKFATDVSERLLLLAATAAAV